MACGIREEITARLIEAVEDAMVAAAGGIVVEAAATRALVRVRTELSNHDLTCKCTRLSRNLIPLSPPDKDGEVS